MTVLRNVGENVGLENGLSQ